jgi:CDP-diacylglycerol---glycerol-3-phosphate 3-phosphatidyltransferase
VNLPNALTLLRIFFVPLLVAALVQESFSLEVRGVVVPHEALALAIFLVAAATDLLDGYLARRWKQITTVGTLFDPIADKLLISAALVALVQVHRLAAWMAILIIGREFAVSGLRSIAAVEGYTIRASDLGKTKMVAQVAGISLIMLSIHWPALESLAQFCMWTVVFFAVVSAVQYFRKFWRGVDDRIKLRRRRELIKLDRKRSKAARVQARAARRAAAQAAQDSSITSPARQSTPASSD